jgi:hypothetical protein
MQRTAVDNLPVDWPLRICEIVVALHGNTTPSTIIEMLAFLSDAGDKQSASYHSRLPRYYFLTCQRIKREGLSKRLIRWRLINRSGIRHVEKKRRVEISEIGDLAAIPKLL